METWNQEELSYRNHINSKIKELINNNQFDIDVFDDPETIKLEADKIDYLGEKPKTRFLTWIANIGARTYFEGLIRKGQIVIDKVEGIENYQKVAPYGAIVAANHVHQFDNYVCLKALENYMPHKRLYKVIREGNYTTKMPFSFFFRHCNTLPLSSSVETMKKFMKSVSILLDKGHTILIYPEQSLWLNYKLPKPYKNGAFELAVKSNAPVVPIYFELNETTTKDKFNKGFNVMAYTIHILEPIYPDKNMGKKENAIYMRDKAYQESKDKYEEIYHKELNYLED